MKVATPSRSLILCVVVAVHLMGLAVILRPANLPQPRDDMTTISIDLAPPVQTLRKPPALAVHRATPISRLVVRTAEPITFDPDPIPQELERRPPLPPPPLPIPKADSRAADNYPALVSAHLATFLHYPSSARLAGQEGLALVILKLGRTGTVIDWHFAHPTGNRILDAEVARMIEAASPFPSFPDSMTQPQQAFSIPVSFNLRRSDGQR